MIKYIQAEWSGKGFITHDDQERDGLVFEYHPGSVLVVEGQEEFIDQWCTRVGGVEKTKQEAQEIVDNEIAKIDEQTLPIGTKLEDLSITLR